MYISDAPIGALVCFIVYLYMFPLHEDIGNKLFLVGSVEVGSQCLNVFENYGLYRVFIKYCVFSNNS